MRWIINMMQRAFQRILIPVRKQNNATHLPDSTKPDEWIIRLQLIKLFSKRPHLRSNKLVHVIVLGSVITKTHFLRHNTRFPIHRSPSLSPPAHIVPISDRWIILTDSFLSPTHRATTNLCGPPHLVTFYPYYYLSRIAHDIRSTISRTRGRIDRRFIRFDRAALRYTSMCVRVSSGRDTPPWPWIIWFW